jgi:hypothetical protein
VDQHLGFSQKTHCNQAYLLLDNFTEYFASSNGHLPLSSIMPDPSKENERFSYLSSRQTLVAVNVGRTG